MPKRETKPKYISYKAERKRELRNAARTAATVAGHELRTKWLKKLTGQRTGRMYRVPETKRMYRVPGTKRMYQASAPGEAPASRLGDFRRSIKFEVATDKSGTDYYFGTDLEYPYFLEFSMDRPSLLPTFEENKQAVKQLMSKTFSEAMDGKVTLEFQEEVTGE